MNEQNTQATENQTATKFCKHCGGKIPADAVMCTICGRQVEELKGTSGTPTQIVVNNTNANSNVNNNVNAAVSARLKNKWVAVCLCFFLGAIGAHKFYEGKVGMGILYIFTLGLLGIGVIIDFITLLFKPNPYMV